MARLILFTSKWRANYPNHLMNVKKSKLHRKNTANAMTKTAWHLPISSASWGGLMGVILKNTNSTVNNKVNAHIQPKHWIYIGCLKWVTLKLIMYCPIHAVLTIAKTIACWCLLAKIATKATVRHMNI